MPKSLNDSWSTHPEGYLGDALLRVQQGKIPIIETGGLRVSTQRYLAKEQLERDMKADEWI